MFDNMVHVRQSFEDDLVEMANKEEHLDDVERNKFEKWISSELFAFGITRSDCGKYQSPSVELAWQSWQECWYELSEK